MNFHYNNNSSPVSFHPANYLSESNSINGGVLKWGVTPSPSRLGFSIIKKPFIRVPPWLWKPPNPNSPHNYLSYKLVLGTKSQFTPQCFHHKHWAPNLSYKLK